MTAKAGKDFLLKIGDGAGSEVFTTIGGLRSSSISLNNEAIDVTAQDSSQWTTLLDGAGIKKVTVSGSGIFEDTTSEQQMLTDHLAGTLRDFQLADGVGVFAGKFKITKMERKGDYKGSQDWSMSLESSGAVTYA